MRKIATIRLDRRAGTIVSVEAMQFLHISNDGTEIRLHYHQGDKPAKVYEVRLHEDGDRVTEGEVWIGSTTLRNGAFARVYHAYAEVVK